MLSGDRYAVLFQCLGNLSFGFFDGGWDGVDIASPTDRAVGTFGPPNVLAFLDLENGILVADDAAFIYDVCHNISMLSKLEIFDLSTLLN